MTRLSLILVSSAAASLIAIAPLQQPSASLTAVPAKTRSLSGSHATRDATCATARKSSGLSVNASCRSLAAGTQGPRG